jgi:hypothetical protein
MEHLAEIRNTAESPVVYQFSRQPLIEAIVKHPSNLSRKVSILVLFAVFFFRCASAPEDRLASAQEALNQARETEAEVYASDKFQEAVEAFESAQTEIKAQDQKWFFSRDYARTEGFLGRAENAAKEAAEVATANKQQAKANAQDALQDATEAIETARQELKTAPTGKGAEADLQALDRGLLQAESTLEEARQELKTEAYLDALSKLQSAREEALKVVAEIRTVR